MLSLLHNTALFIDALNERIGKFISWLTVAMVGTTFLVVVLRYGFDIGWIAMQESVTYMHAVAFMIGAAYTLKYDGHVRVDIFYRSASRLTQAWIDLLGTVFLLLPVTGFILWASWDYVYISWTLLEGSREAGGLPLVFLLKSCIPIMSGLLALQGVSSICHSLITIMGKTPI